MYDGLNFGAFVKLCLVVLFLSEVNASFKRGVPLANATGIHITQAPSTVQLRFNNRVFCSGTLVDPEYVVTAYSCLQYASPFHIIVVGGATDTDIADVGLKSRILGLDIPTKFEKEDEKADVVVLRLETPMRGGFPQSTELCGGPLPSNRSVPIFGWGDKETELQKAEVLVEDWTECQAKYKFDFPLNRFMLCSTPNKWQNSCQGDAGGPILYGPNRQLCAIITFPGDCALNKPAIYSNVDALRFQIEDSIERMRRVNMVRMKG